MKLNKNMINTIVSFATVFTVATLQVSQAHAGPSGKWSWWGITTTDLGSGR
ncbi:MAG: hypothetical protein ACR2O8_13940 [Rhizobiaceae bacterium]